VLNKLHARLQIYKWASDERLHLLDQMLMCVLRCSWVTTLKMYTVFKIKKKKRIVCLHQKRSDYSSPPPSHSAFFRAAIPRIRLNSLHDNQVVSPNPLNYSAESFFLNIQSTFFILRHGEKEENTGADVALPPIEESFINLL
jgi:hypothetical protein